MAHVLDPLLTEEITLSFPKPGDLVEGFVLGIGKSFVLVALQNGDITGVIRGRELNDSMGTAKSLKVGDSVLAAVIDDESEDGTLLLSFRKASQARAWTRFEKAFETKETIEVVAEEANKGGLLLMIDGVKGFLPVSQLAPENYPRVDGADATQIVSKLQVLVGKKFRVKIITLDKEGNKMVLSERETAREARAKEMSELRIGQKVRGKVTGVVKFGLFVQFGNLEGLVHISEIAWAHVRDSGDAAKLGDEVDVVVIGVEGDKISLSMKQLTPDPWMEATEKMGTNSTVMGTVQKMTDHGAIVELGEGVSGLLHTSEMIDGGESFEIGQKIEVNIIEVDTKEHRVSLSRKRLSTSDDAAGEKSTKKKAKKTDVEEVTE